MLNNTIDLDKLNLSIHITDKIVLKRILEMQFDDLNSQIDERYAQYEKLSKSDKDLSVIQTYRKNWLLGEISILNKKIDVTRKYMRNINRDASDVNSHFNTWKSEHNLDLSYLYPDSLDN